MASSSELGRGLINRGNTCFLNAIAQALAGLNPFRRYLVELVDNGYSNDLIIRLKQTLDGTYQNDHIQGQEESDLNARHPRTPFVPALLGEAGLAKIFLSGSQQDAHELLIYFLNQIELLILPSPSDLYHPSRFLGVKHLLSSPKLDRPRVSLLCHPANPTKINQFQSFHLKPLSFVPRAQLDLIPPKMLTNPANKTMSNRRSNASFGSPPFHGKLHSTLYCPACKHTWLTTQVISVISLYPPHTNTPNSPLSECLDSFSKREKVYQVQCRYCQKPRTLIKHMTIALPPNLLCLHFNRIQIDQKSKAWIKNKTRVQFKRELDIESITSHYHSVTDQDTVHRDWVRVPASMDVYLSHLDDTNPVGDDSNRSDSNGISQIQSNSIGTKYNLMAVIVHYGDAYGGHYVCFRAKNPHCLDDEWIKISDGALSCVKFSVVQEQEAFMLFYQKREPDGVIGEEKQKGLSSGWMERDVSLVSGKRLGFEYDQNYDYKLESMIEDGERDDTEYLRQEELKREKLKQEELKQEKLKQEESTLEQLKLEQLSEFKQEQLKQEELNNLVLNVLNELKLEELNESKLEESKLEESKLEKSSLEESNIEESSLEESNLEKSKLESKLEESNLEESKLEESKLEKSNLEESNLEKSSQEQSKLESKLEESSLEESKLEESKLEESKLEESNLEESKPEESNLEKSNLEKSNIEESNLEESKLEKSSQEESKLEKSSQEDSKLESKLEESNLEESNLEESNLEESKQEEFKPKWLNESKPEELNQEDLKQEQLSGSKPGESNTEELKLDEFKQEQLNHLNDLVLKELQSEFIRSNGLNQINLQHLNNLKLQHLRGECPD